MFAIPGILGLILFIYVRPQEILLDLQRLPLLYLFFGLALFGFAVDLRLRVNKAAPAPQLLWAILLFVWAIITMVIKAPDVAMRGATEFAVSITLFFVIAHSVHTFRAFQIVTGLVLGIVVALALIGVHQGTADYGCVMIDPRSTGDLSVGTPDGRPCRPLLDLDCYLRGEPEPGADYICERIGLFGTTSVAGRVRYRGVLQDPNELALALSVGLAFAFAFAARRRAGGGILLVALTMAAVMVCVYFTQSRGGQVVFLSVLAVYAVWRWRWRAVAVMALMAPPGLLVMGGGTERVDAAASSEERMEAWMTGLDLFRSSPIVGVGQGQFVEHHHLTAHNSYVLALAETGIIGFMLWSAVLYVSVKTLLMAVMRYRGVEEARVAQSWGLALLASVAGLCVGIFFLSFAWHHLFWIYMGLVGAYYQAIRTHDPEFRVRMGWLDWGAIAGLGLVVMTMLWLYLRLHGL
ncbi:MAG TPA: O-antigen ligase family protein [Kofleriaceae bacterium]|nr:O-antigen ligase family protein [Kofleriaceae bacterium]